MNDKINDINTLLVPRAPLAAPAQAVPAPGAPRDPSITLDFKMATDLLKMFGGEPGLVTLQQGSERSHSGTGIYALYSHLPEEGAEFLGAEPDNKAMPEPSPAQDDSLTAAYMAGAHDAAKAARAAAPCAPAIEAAHGITAAQKGGQHEF